MSPRLRHFVAPFVCLSIAALAPEALAGFVNWESAPVHPLELTPDGLKLLACNIADNRLEVFSLATGAPVWINSIPVGLDPTSVRARTNTEAWVVNRISDSISIVNLTTMNVSATLFVGDEPGDVVFSGALQKAWVSISSPPQLKAFSPANLAAAPTLVTLALYDPRAMAADSTHVYVAAFNSGNVSTVLNAAVASDPTGPWSGQNPPPNSGASFNPPINPANPPAPPTALIINREIGHWRDDNNAIWDAKAPWGLNTNDVAIINPATLAVTYAHDVANILTAMTIQPGTNAPTVLGEYLVNEHRFEQAARDTLSHVRIITFDPANPFPANGPLNHISDLNQHLFVNPPIPIYKQSVTQAEHDLSIGLVRGVAWNTNGTFAYVAGMGSNNVIRTNALGQRFATINVGQGPTGLVFDGPRSRVYCLNRFDATLSIINTANDTELGRVSFFDPTPASIKTGRPLFYDTHLTSMRGQVSCASCHVDGKTDMQAWDAGDPAGAMKPLNQSCNAGIPLVGACNDWHPMKGALMTQTLVDLTGAEPFHWRGDREDLLAFSAGFPGFLGTPAPTPAQMADLQAFLNTLVSPPQPNRTMTDTLPASIVGYSGNPANGASLFNGPPIGGGAVKCTDCHGLPTGGSNTLISANLLGQSQALKIPQLRDLYRQTGFSKASLNNTRGFGYSHDGSFDSIFAFLSGHFATPTDPQRRDLEAFLVCFPTATHPAVGVQITFTGTNNNDATATALLNTMLSLADSGAVGVVAKGIVVGLPRGYYYLPNTGNMQSDRLVQIVSAASLRQSAAAGAEITFTVVPTNTEQRIGVDRDEDGYFDRDELDQCSNPMDPHSIPGAPGADIDGNGVEDQFDVAAFIAVLMGTPQNPSHIARSDMNCDMLEDGRDIQGFVASLLLP